jgi:hypothetical protein
MFSDAMRLIGFGPFFKMLLSRRGHRAKLFLNNQGFYLIDIARGGSQAMDLRTFMFERRITGKALVRAAAAKGHHLTSPDISNVVSRRDAYYPPSDRVRTSMIAAMRKIGIARADIDTIEELKVN